MVVEGEYFLGLRRGKNSKKGELISEIPNEAHPSAYRRMSIVDDKPNILPTDYTYAHLLIDKSADNRLNHSLPVISLVLKTY